MLIVTMLYDHTVVTLQSRSEMSRVLINTILPNRNILGVGSNNIILGVGSNILGVGSILGVVHSSL